MADTVQCGCLCGIAALGCPARQRRAAGAAAQPQQISATGEVYNFSRSLGAEIWVAKILHSLRGLNNNEDTLSVIRHRPDRLRILRLLVRSTTRNTQSRQEIGARSISRKTCGERHQ